MRPDASHPQALVRPLLLLAFLGVALAADPPPPAPDSGQTAKDQHALIGATAVTKEANPHTKHPDAQWFGEAGLGLFVHWGISSVHGNLDISWSMIAGKPWDRPEPGIGGQVITPEEYFALATRFKPDRYDPDRWLRAAKEAGFRYAVFTTKHHDGFALWPSDVGEFGVKQYLPGVDLVKTYVEACRKNGLKVGLYYSPPDWYFNRNYMSFHYGSEDQKRFPGRKPIGMKHEVLEALPTKPVDFHASNLAYVRAQIEELLTRYGTIDVLWFDGGPNAMPVEAIRALQPGIVINPRMHGTGDFMTPEGHLPKGPIAGWWEMCHIWAPNSWGYNTAHEQYKPSGWMLSQLAAVRTWGGNLLINAGPRPSGEMPDSYYERMSEVADWMRHSGPAVFDVKPGPYPTTVNVPVTVRDRTWYLLLPPEHQGPVTIRRADRPISVKLLRNGAALVPVMSDEVWSIEVPTAERTALVDVVEVKYGVSDQAASGR
jgi:alpha-L-fucosidase